jgi:GT2 family glycosyltransferase
MDNTKTSAPLFSIIIPLMDANDYLAETCENLKKLQNQDFELIVIPNEKTSKLENLLAGIKNQIIPAGNISPAIKRDLGVREAKGKYIAFIDDDAYPKEDWLDVAEKYLSRLEVSALGGPQITPPKNTFWQKVSGAVFLSPLSGTALKRYYPQGKGCFVDDWPTVNFFIKKAVFEESGGFDSKYWPGEDTKLCLDIIKKLKKKIFYAPELQVYHHRRAGFKKHLKQIGNYGLHRGFFAKELPENSNKFMYFIPSLLDIFIVFGFISSLLYPILWKFYFLGIAVYLLAILFSTVIIWKRSGSFFISLMTISYIISTHIWYGLRFIQGFIFTKKLKSKLGR